MYELRNLADNRGVDRKDFVIAIPLGSLHIKVTQQSILKNYT